MKHITDQKIEAVLAAKGGNSSTASLLLPLAVSPDIEADLIAQSLANGTIIEPAIEIKYWKQTNSFEDAVSAVAEHRKAQLEKCDRSHVLLTDEMREAYAAKVHIHTDQALTIAKRAWAIRNNNSTKGQALAPIPELDFDQLSVLGFRELNAAYLALDAVYKLMVAQSNS